METRVYDGIKFLVQFLTLSQTSPGFYVSAAQTFENTVGKGEIARMSNFSFSLSVFDPFW